MMPVCMWCGKELPQFRIKFCCDKCSSSMRYFLHKEEIKAKSASWKEKNPERFRQNNNIAVNRYLMEQRERFNKLCNLAYYKKKIRKLELELAEEKNNA